ncbi:DNA-binding protein [Roseateles subflavus]|uniref:DNA-binding protein n=1 Tax=Roseateles subflavus TaxID=3053353 RepID=UPI003312FB1D
MPKITQQDLARVKQEFYLRGESIASWARDRDFPLTTVYQVLSGRCHALRGDSHRIAVALGLKPSWPSSKAVEAPPHAEDAM